jgi:hypothetical protein
MKSDEEVLCSEAAEDTRAWFTILATQFEDVVIRWWFQSRNLGIIVGRRPDPNGNELILDEANQVRSDPRGEAFFGAVLPWANDEAMNVRRDAQGSELDSPQAGRQPIEPTGCALRVDLIVN